LLQAAVAAPDRRLDELALLGAAERHQVTVEWAAAGPAGAADPDPDTALRCVHHLIGDRVARAPAAPAVIADGRVLTYGQLDDQAAAMASALRAAGVGADASAEIVVGLYCRRSPEMIAGLL